MKYFKKVISLVIIILLSILLISCDFGNFFGKEAPKDNTDIEKPAEEVKEEPKEENPEEEEKEEHSEGSNSETIVKINFDFSNKDIIASEALKKYDLSYDSKGHETYQKAVLDCIKDKKGLEDLNKAYDAFSEYVSSINDKYIVAGALYYADKEGMYDAYQTLYSYLLELQTIQEEIDHEIAKSSYAKEFFSGYSDEEIALLAEKDVDNDDLNNALVKRQDLMDQYAKAVNDRSRSNILKEFVSNNKKIAVLQGFDASEYIEYSDINNYYRQYDSTDVEEFIENVKTYLMDLVFDIYQIDLTPSSMSDKRKLNDYLTGNILKDKSLFDAYVESVNGTYKEAYDYLFNEGYYIFASTDSSEGFAFEDGSDDINLVFFGLNCHDYSTFAHEFGHYHAHFLGTDYCSYDLCETQSQASEVLFRLYLSEKYPGIVSTCYEESLIFNLLSTVLDGVMIREYEEKLYTTNFSSCKQVWDKLNEEEYDGWGYDDWYDIFIDYDNYYISYATSALASLLVYAYGKENGFAKACELYLDIVSFDGYGDISGALKSVNLYDPLSKEAIIYLKNTITKISEDEWK